MTKKAKAENDMTKMLVVVVLMFVTCQILNPIRRIMKAVLPAGGTGCGSAYFYITYLISPALAIEASSHFFIYSVCNKSFTRKLSQKWRRLVSRMRVAPASIGQQAAGPAAVPVPAAVAVAMIPIPITVKSAPANVLETEERPQPVGSIAAHYCAME